jgi:coatomer subunit beta'
MGADDMQIRVFNYNTQERLVAFEGHQDYIRHLEVHPSQPFVITCSDDMTAKLWDWEKGWVCVQTYEGHAHYVMMSRINPKDTNTFATASLDRSVKVWSLTSTMPNFSLEGHERGVNCVDYYPGGDKPYIVSGADDQTLRIWDYQTRSVVSVLEGHTNNVCAVAFHPRLPLILSGSEDGTVRVWHNTTYRLETTLNYGFERTWAIAVNNGNNKVALGFDDGTIVVKLGREVPIVSMDRNGKLIMCGRCGPARRSAARCGQN